MKNKESASNSTVTKNTILFVHLILRCNNKGWDVSCIVALDSAISSLNLQNFFFFFVISFFLIHVIFVRPPIITIYCSKMEIIRILISRPIWFDAFHFFSAHDINVRTFILVPLKIQQDEMG